MMSCIPEEIAFQDSSLATTPLQAFWFYNKIGHHQGRAVLYSCSPGLTARAGLTWQGWVIVSPFEHLPGNTVQKL